MNKNKYAILCNPGHNRVYFNESIKLSISELNMVFKKLSTSCHGGEINNIANIPYITFTSDNLLKYEDIKLLSTLSFAYAIFLLKDIDGQILMTPIEKNSYQFVGESIGTILKYTGKTNELFTQMMINVALYSTDFFNEQQINVLDPVVGKGTTLFEGIKRGYNVYGIEMSDKTVIEAYNFAKRYFETEKYKHISKTEKVSGANKSFTATRYNISVAKSKEEAKEKNYRTLEIVSGNSEYANKYYKKNSFHIIVGDLPYGVQHGNITREKQTSLTRNPRELLNSVLGGWRDILMPKGAIVLAWNSFLLSKDDMRNIMVKNGFNPIDEYNCNFEHRVDQAIKRDIIVCVKPIL